MEIKLRGHRDLVVSGSNLGAGHFFSYLEVINTLFLFLFAGLAYTHHLITPFLDQQENRLWKCEKQQTEWISSEIGK